MITAFVKIHYEEHFYLLFSAVRLRETMADTLAELSCWKMRALAAEIESSHLRNNYKDTKGKDLQNTNPQTNKIQSDIILSKKKVLNKLHVKWTQQCASVPEFKMPDIHAKALATNYEKFSSKRPKEKRKVKKRKSAKKTDVHGSSSENDEPKQPRGKNDGQVLKTKRSSTQRNSAIKNTVHIKLPPIHPPKH